MVIKFKIGDRVRCINQGNKGMGWELDRIFKIDHYDERLGGVAYWEKNNSLGVYEDSLELVEKNKKKPFNKKDLIL